MQFLGHYTVAGLRFEEWLVELGDPLPEGMGPEQAGLCDTDTGKIYYVRRANKTFEDNVKAHERMHAAFYASGVSSILKSKDAEGLEESIIDALVPAQLGARARKAPKPKGQSATDSVRT
jgi:hypothetical protein